MPDCIESLEYRCGIHNSCKFAVEIAESSCVNILCPTITAVDPNPVESGSSIGNDVRKETQVSRHPRCCGYAMIGG